KFSSFDPRVTLSYQPTRDLNFYASYNQGFKSGGFQYVPFSAAQANVVFEPESLDAYEVGFKTQLLDRRLTFNGSAYYYDYKDLQVLRVVAVPGGGAATLITNAATSEIKGFELELVARPSDRFEANLSYAYTDAKYKSFPFNATTDFSDTRLVRAPVHSVNAGAQWTIPFGGDNSLQLRADYGLLDLRATARIGDFRVSAFVMNATDKYYRRTVLALPGQLVGYPGAPRTYGLTVGWSM
ncbi:MAG: TonB-dependent receptor, partial [Pseudomonadota bacterium]